MTDEQMLDVIASVCGFDRVGVERWRAEALIIGRAVEKAALEAANARIAELSTCKLCRSTGHDTPCAYPTEINRQQAKRIAELESRLAANGEPVAWFDKALNTVRWKDGLVNADFSEGQPFYAGPIAANGADSASPTLNEGEQAMQDACATLPGGYLIEVNLENGAGWVDLYHDGEKADFDEDTDSGMSGRIRAATAAAIAASAEKGEKA